MIALAIFVFILFLYSLVSHRVERSVLTAPLVFTVAGMLMSPLRPEFMRLGVNSQVFLRVAEIGLVLLLFTDASRADLKVLRSLKSLPTRLLSVGLLLTVLLGAVVAKMIFPHLSFWEAGILGAILAPTDAGLGQVIVQSPRVPIRIREAINVEAGLNDGISVPFLLFFMSLAGAKIEGGVASLMQFILEQLGVGVLIGAAIGLLGGSLLAFAHQRRWITKSFREIGLVALPLLCMLASEMFDASMFIASFVAGLAVQMKFKEASKHSIEFSEEWGQLFNLSVFFLFGMIVVGNWPQFGLLAWFYALLSLTLVRMGPVAGALLGTRLSAASIVFIGWFGPRGLASIVLGLVYLEQELHLPGEPTIRMVVMVTVFLSIFVHGLSAMSGIALYARKIASLPATAPEHQGVRS